jgi:hypothetical protein
MITFALHNIWWLVAAVVALFALALIIRKRVKRMMKLAKAAATDKRLPRPVRWLFRIGIAAKVFPGPDFGIDEVCLGLGVILLYTKYRQTWALIRSEIAAKEIADSEMRVTK